MLYAVLCYNDEKEVTAWPQEKEDRVMADLIAVQEKMVAKGKLGPVARLAPTTQATTLRKSKGKPIVLDGPFAETKEQFLGFYVIDCADLDEAMAFVQELAVANPGSGAFEVRPMDVFVPNEIKSA
ncbi:MAG TPA: YciI family protein [Rhizobiaceae bacterium]|nr:YciI family protein [Rhizobiaceae bacterium]